MRFTIGYLALTCLLVGMLPALVIGTSLRAAVAAVLGTRNVPDYSLAVWHGVTTPLLMSLFAFVVGCLLYARLRRYFAACEVTPLIGRISGKRAFERVLGVLTTDLPPWFERAWPGRRLQPQLLLIVLVALLAGGLAVGGASLGVRPRGSSVDPAFALLWLLGAACAIGAAALAKFHRLAALILTGGAGLVLCINFVWLSAPDLAATQLLVEVVSTILILLGLRWLPKRIKGLSRDGRLYRFHRWRDGVVAAVIGLGVASLAYAAMMHHLEAGAARVVDLAHETGEVFVRQVGAEV